MKINKRITVSDRSLINLSDKDRVVTAVERIFEAAFQNDAAVRLGSGIDLPLTAYVGKALAP